MGYALAWGMGAADRGDPVAFEGGRGQDGRRRVAVRTVLQEERFGADAPVFYHAGEVWTARRGPGASRVCGF